MPIKNTHSRIEEMEGRAAVERSEPGGRAELDGGRARSAGPTMTGSGRRPGPPAELVDEALARARLRERGMSVEQLPDEVRDQLTDGLIDELLADSGARSQQEVLGRDGLLGDPTRRLVERAMDAELTEHLGYAPGQAPPGGAGNARNGATPKTLLGDHGEVRIERPRDRNGSFEPKLVPNGQRRLAGIDEKIVALPAG